MSGPASTVGGAFNTVMINVSLPTPPSSSRTVNVTVYVPASPQACDALTVPTDFGGVCVSVTIPAVGACESFQSQVASCASGYSTAVKVPVNAITSPSFTVWSGPAFTTGGTFLTRTIAKCRLMPPPAWFTTTFNLAI